MLRVLFMRLSGKGDYEPIGSITWDGHQFSCDPPEQGFLQHVLGQSTVEEDEVISPKNDPEKWMSALSSTYHGSYLWAGDVQQG